MKIAVDATPLLGTRTGVGHYTAHLLGGLAQAAIASRDGTSESLEVAAVPFTLRNGSRPPDLPAEVAWRHRPFSARVLQKLWTHLPIPPVQLFAGNVDVFHGTNFVLPPVGSARGVLTIHDLSFLRYPELVSRASLAYRGLVPRGLKRARVVLTPTAAVAAELVDAYRLDPAKVMVTSLGVDAAWATAEPMNATDLALLGLPSTYLLAVGTLEPRKGLDVLIEAYSQMVGRGHDVPPLVLVGAAGWGPAVDTARLGVGRVYLPGYLDHAHLRRVVAGAAAFVFPSRYEGFGLPPLEALAAGVPVVASDIPTSVEVLHEHALYAPVGDAEALADAIGQILTSPPGPSARASAVAHALSWTWQRCIEQTLAGYQAAVAD